MPMLLRVYRRRCRVLPPRSKSPSRLGPTAKIGLNHDQRRQISPAPFGRHKPPPAWVPLTLHMQQPLTLVCPCSYTLLSPHRPITPFHQYNISFQNLDVDDGNRPAKENVPTSDAPLVADNGLYPGQTWGWSGFDQRRINTPYVTTPSFHAG